MRIKHWKYSVPETEKETVKKLKLDMKSRLKLQTLDIQNKHFFSTGLNGLPTPYHGSKIQRYCFGPPEGAHHISWMQKEHTDSYVEKINESYRYSTYIYVCVWNYMFGMHCLAHLRS